MSRNPTLVLLCAILLFAAIVNLNAQGVSGSIEGTVTDDSAQPVPGTEIMVESTGNTAGYKKTVTTDEKGYFVLVEVPAGTYVIQAKKADRSAASRTVSVESGQRTRVSPSLTTGGPSPGRAAAARYPWEELPTRTTFSSVLRFAPTLRSEVLAGGLQVTGASGAENRYFIDGHEVTNFRTGLLNSNNDLPFGFLQEVKVVASGVEARFGGGTGGTINVVSRGGGNDWRGNLGMSFTPAGPQGDPNVVLSRFTSSFGGIEYFQPRKDSASAYFPTATISGPVLRDKIWFLASYAPQIYKIERTIDYFTSPNPATRSVRESIRYKSDVRTEEAFVRLDSQPMSRLRVFGTFLYNPIIQDGVLPPVAEGLQGLPQSGNGLRGAEFLATRGGRQNANMVNGQITWDPLDNFVLNVRAGRSFLNEKLNSYGMPRITRFVCSGSPFSIPGSGCSTGFQNVANNSVRDYDASVRTTFDADAVFPGIEALGRHNFRGGYQLNRLFNEVKDGYTDTGTVVLFYGVPISNLTGQPSTPGNLGSGYLQRFGLVGEAGSSNHALFAQDSWQIVPRLTLNLGVRFENEEVANFVAEESQSLEFGWGDKIAPRIGFALDVFGNGKTRAFGTYGIYYDRLKYELPRAAFGGEFFRRDYFEILPSRGAHYSNYTYSVILGNNTDQIGGTCPITNTTGYSICQFDFRLPVNLPDSEPLLAGAVDPDIKPARQTEFSFGVDQELPGGFSVSGRYLRKQLDRTVEDIGGLTPQGLQAYVVGNPGFGLACEVAGSMNAPCPKAERNFDALAFAVNKRASSYFFNVNYTFSRLTGNYSGLASSDEFGLVAPNRTAYFNSPSQGFDASGEPDNGRLPTDRPHVLKAFGGYSFGWPGRANRTSVSAFTTVRSGTPLTTVYGLFGAATSILFGRRDLGRTETFSETDLQVSHQYRFGNENRFLIEPYVVVLNLFDERNEIARQTLISSTNFTSSTLTAGGCTTCSTPAAVYDTIFSRGGIRQFVLNYISARGTSLTGFRNDYGLPILFQDPRYVRFGLRFRF